MTWLTLLNDAVRAKGMASVAAKLGYRSKSVVCEAIKGTYKGNLERLQARVMEVFGQPEAVDCPVLGRLTGQICGVHRDTAKRLGVRGGNVQTLMLRKACLNCVRTKEASHVG